eukprot:11623835-Alexandrium_andersonii.AAC.1
MRGDICPEHAPNAARNGARAPASRHPLRDPPPPPPARRPPHHFSAGSLLDLASKIRQHARAVLHA